MKVVNSLLDFKSFSFMASSSTINAQNTPVSSVEPSSWKDDMREWPDVTYGDIYNYLVERCAIDGKEMKNFKSMDSYNYFQSGGVGKILHMYVENSCIRMKAEVRPSQKTNAQYHKASVLCGFDGTVYSGECSCVAGKSRTCSHVGAILWKVEYAVRLNMTGKSCTDNKALWNRGTTRNIEPKTIGAMSFNRPNLQNDLTYQNNDSENTNQGTNDFLMFASHLDLKTHIDNSELKELFYIQNSIIHASVSASPVVNVQKMSNNHGSHTNINDTCVKCKLFYDKYVNFSPSQIVSLNKYTTGQASSRVWRDSRKIRITGSSASKVPTRSTTNPDTFIKGHLYPSFKGNVFTEHGIKEEIHAKEYLRVNGFNIEDSGTLVSEENPWLSASPDGIIHTDSGDKLLEIKCPVIASNFSCLEDLFVSGKYDVVKENGKNVLKPKGSRGYYLQIQITLYTSQLKQCELVIWTSQEFSVIKVLYDPEYTNSAILHLKDFYFTKFLPRMVDDFEAGRISLSREYKSLCQ